MKSKTIDRMHTATHLVPGVPAHEDAPAAHREHGANRHPHAENRRPRPQNRAHHDSPPRVLVAWQNWIAALVGRKPL